MKFTMMIIQLLMILANTGTTQLTKCLLPSTASSCFFLTMALCWYVLLSPFYRWEKWSSKHWCGLWSGSLCCQSLFYKLMMENHGMINLCIPSPDSCLGCGGISPHCSDFTQDSQAGFSFKLCILVFCILPVFSQSLSPGGQEQWSQLRAEILSLPFSNCVSLGKWRNVSLSQFLYLQKEWWWCWWWWWKVQHYFLWSGAAVEVGHVAFLFSSRAPFPLYPFPDRHSPFLRHLYNLGPPLGPPGSPAPLLPCRGQHLCWTRTAVPRLHTIGVCGALSRSHRDCLPSVRWKDWNRTTTNTQQFLQPPGHTLHLLSFLPTTPETFGFWCFPGNLQTSLLSYLYSQPPSPPQKWIELHPMSSHPSLPSDFVSSRYAHQGHRAGGRWRHLVGAGWGLQFLTSLVCQGPAGVKEEERLGKCAGQWSSQ